MIRCVLFIVGAAKGEPHGSQELLFHDEAHAKLYAGLDTLSNAVKVKLGQKGRAVVLGKRTAPRQLLTSEMAGDGTTTATVSVHAPGNHDAGGVEHVE